MRTTVLVGTLAIAGCASTEGQLVANATTQDHRCLAEAIYHEAGNEPMAGRHAVGHVVINRSRSGRYPNSICGVVYDRGHKNRGCQFSWSCRRHKAPTGELWQQAQEVATLIINGKSRDVTLGALNFHGRKDPVRYSTKRYQRTAIIGGHTFWRPKQLAAYNRQGDLK